MNSKIVSLSKVLDCKVEDLKPVTLKNAWYEVEAIEDIYNNDFYLVLNDHEHYYNAEMYGTDTMQDIGKEEYYIFRM